MTQILDPYEIYTERSVELDEGFHELVRKAVEDNQAALDRLATDEVDWDLGPACSIDPDDTCESCQ